MCENRNADGSTTKVGAIVRGLGGLHIDFSTTLAKKLPTMSAEVSPVRQLKESFLNSSDIEVPCSSGTCEFCDWSFSSFSEAESIDRVWSELMQLAQEGACDQALRAMLATKGSIFSLEGFCFHCQKAGTDMWSNPRHMAIEDVIGPVELETFCIRRYPYRTNTAGEGYICDRHQRAKIELRCFGDLPQFCLLKSARKLGGRTTSLEVVPIRYTEDGQDVVTIVDPRDTLLEKCMYVGNPCYDTIWWSSRASIKWMLEGTETSYYLVRMKQSHWDDSRWNLSEVAESKPFTTLSGRWKILEAMSSALGPYHLQDVNIFPPQVPKRCAARTLTGRTPVLLDVSDGDSEDVRETEAPCNNSDEDSDQIGVEDCDEEATASNPKLDDILDGMRGRKPTSIPFLFASYPFLWYTTFGNEHYPPSSSEEKKSMEEATTAIMQNPDLFVSGTSATQLMKVGIERDAVLSTSFQSLELSCDMDSIDLVSLPWAGMVFRGGLVRILSLYGPHMREPSKYLARNNNLVRFRQYTAPFPGRHFLPTSHFRSAMRRNEEERERDPIAIRLFDVKTSLCMNNLKVRALIPSGSVACVVDGHGYLLVLFNSVVARGADMTRGRGGPTDRSTACAFFWFIIKELLTLVISLISREVKYPKGDSSGFPCCAVPSPLNRSTHDRHRGPNSSQGGGIDVDEDEVALAFHLAARMFAALEVVSELPRLSCTFRDLEREQYKVPEYLFDLLEDEATIACLQLEIGDERCLEFFRERVWNGQKCFGGIMEMTSDIDRRGTNALPSVRSNKKAFDQGFMVLEDLLIIAPVVFRVTEHGMKNTFRTSRKGNAVKNVLEREFDIGMVQDGVVDIGFTIDGPRNEGWAITLPVSTAKTKLLTPFEICNKSLRQLNINLYSANGYPNIVGVSTQKGHVGEPKTALRPETVRRVKCYASNRRFDATRGASIHEVASRPLQNELLDSCRVSSQWMNLRGTVPAAVRAKSEEVERRRNRLFHVLNHDIERRLGAVGNSTEGFGVRLELTFASGENWNFMEDAIHLLELQEKRRSMSPSEFQEHFKAHPEEWPWYMRVPRLEEKKRRNEESYELTASLMPVTILKCKVLMKFEIEVETSLLRSAYKLYASARALVSRSDANIPEGRNEFYDTFLRQAPQNVAVEMGLMICRGLLTASSLLVDSEPLQIADLYLRTPPYILSACGLDTSYRFGGVPAVICSRVLSLQECYERCALPVTSDGNVGSVIVRELGMESEEMLTVATNLDVEMEVPAQVMLGHRMNLRGFMARVLGGNPDVGTPFIPNEREEKRRGRIHSVISSLFRTDNRRSTRRALLYMATVVVILLESDCCIDLNYMLGYCPSRERSGDESEAHHEITYPSITANLAKALSRIAIDGSNWPDHRRIDSYGDLGGRGQRDIREEEELEIRMKGLLSFYRGSAHGVNALGDERIVHCRTTLTDEDGAVQINKFIQALWERSGFLPHFAEINEERVQEAERRGKRNFHNWKCLICLRIIEGLIEEENDRLLRVDERTREHGISAVKEIFMEKFPEYMARAMRAAGFLNICPLLCDSLPGSEGQRTWGPVVIFTVLRYNDEELSPLLRADERGGHLAVSRIAGERLWRTRRRMLGTFVTALRTYRTAFRRMARNLIEVQETEERKAALREVRNLRRKFWSQNAVGDLITEYFGDIREANSDISLNKESYDYCLRVLECLIGVRRQIAEEGMGVFEVTSDGHTEMRSLARIRVSDGNEVTGAEEAFGTELNCYKKPWSVAGYPKSTETRNGKGTKKITVRACATLLFRTEIVFKCVPSLGRRVKKLEFQKFAGVTVGRIYKKYRDGNLASCERSHSMWRLAPDGVLLKALEKHFVRRAGGQE